MPITATTRLCPICRTALPEPPAAPVCAACGRLACPHHTDWPLELKQFLASELVRRRLLPWLSEQDVWERLLREAFVASSATQPSVDVRISTMTPIAEVYPIALERARAWQRAGVMLGQPLVRPKRIPA